MSFATWFFFFVAIEHIGELELAASNVLRSISTMLYMVVGALGAAASSLTANLVGQERVKQVGPTCGRIIRLGFAIELALCMLLAHGFAFTNLFPNHDSTVLVFDAQWTMYVLGRWAQNLYFPLVRGKIAAPWLIGAFSIVYLALTGYIIAKLLHLRRWSAALLTGLLGTCASVTAQLATYTYETDAYLLAMLLACAAVWCSRRLPRLWGYAGAAVCLCGCLALYQSYIQFAVGLYLLLLLQSALQGAEWRPWLRQGVGALLTLALGAVLYVVSLKVSLALTGYQLADTGNGLAQMFRLGPAAVLGGIPATYGNFFKTLLGYSGWNDRGMRAATALLFVLAALAGLRWLVVLHDRKAAAAAVVLVALLPAAANVTDVINTGATVALRMAGSLAIVVPFAIAVIDAAPALTERAFSWGMALCTAFCAVLLRGFAVQVNNDAAVMLKQKTTVVNLANRLCTRLEENADYQNGAEVVILGEPKRGAYPEESPLKPMAGELAQFGPLSYDPTFNAHGWYVLVWDELGVQLNECADETVRAISNSDAFKAMPNYPADGCIQTIDGVVTLKVADFPF